MSLFSQTILGLQDLNMESDTTTTLYCSRKGHIATLTKYLNRMTVELENSKDIASVINLAENIEVTIFKINKITEKLSLLLPDNEKHKAKALCSEHKQRA